jgi:DNA topoisomerase-3
MSPTTLILTEKPAVAEDYAKILGGGNVNPIKTACGRHWETPHGIIAGLLGHMLEGLMPEDYDEKYKRWRFGDLPVVPNPFRYVPAKEKAGRLKEIGALLKKATDVVIATDAGREGEMIGWEVLEHFRFRGPVKRLWLNENTPEKVRAGFNALLAGEVKKPQYHAAKARSEADWLIGMNITRGASLKFGGRGNVLNIGRVITPTIKLIVMRDLAIENFKSRDFFEISANVGTDKGTVTLYYAPPEKGRIFERAKVEELAARITGSSVVIRREVEAKRSAPPKLFTLTSVSSAANKKWGWSLEDTLKVAQSLYDKKFTTYPRTDCPFLESAKKADIPMITGYLFALDEFKHHANAKIAARNSVYNDTGCAGADHQALVPSSKPANLSEMNEEERKFYLLVAGRYLANLLPDHEYDKTTLSAEAGGVKLSASGRTPKVKGWHAVEAEDEGDDDKDAVPTLPAIPDGTSGRVEKTGVVGRKTTPPAHYTEGTLAPDMENVGKYVTDLKKRARLKNAERAGIGTSATRPDVMRRIKSGGFAALKGKYLISTTKARSLIATLDTEIPALADPAETAVWDEQLEEIGKGRMMADAFKTGIEVKVNEYLSILGKRPDAEQAPAGEDTGVTVKGVPLVRYFEPVKKYYYYSASGAFDGRIFVNMWGHNLTSDEVVALVERGEEITMTNCTDREGKLLGSAKTAYYDAKAKPYPGVFMKKDEIAGGGNAGEDTGIPSPRGGGNIMLHRSGKGDYYTVPGYTYGPKKWTVWFYRTLAKREIATRELVDVLKSGKDGVRMSGFKKVDGSPFRSDPIVFFNSRKERPGLDFRFE